MPAGDKLITAADIIIDNEKQTDVNEWIIPMVETHQPPQVPTVENITAKETMALQDELEQVAVEVQEEQIEAHPIPEETIQEPESMVSEPTID